MNGYKKRCFDGEKKCFRSYFTVKKGVSTVFPWWCFHRKNEKCLATATSLNGTSLYGVCTVFQRCVKGDKKRILNGFEKKHVWTAFQRCLRGEKKSCFLVKKVVSTVKKEVFSQWLYGDKKGVSTIFERLQKSCFHGEKRGVFKLFLEEKKVVSTVFL